MKRAVFQEWINLGDKHLYAKCSGNVVSEVVGPAPWRKVRVIVAVDEVEDSKGNIYPVRPTEITKRGCQVTFL